MGHENGCRTMPSILKDVVVKAVAAMLCIWHQIVYKTEEKALLSNASKLYGNP